MCTSYGLSASDKIGWILFWNVSRPLPGPDFGFSNTSIFFCSPGHAENMFWMRLYGWFASNELFRAERILSMITWHVTQLYEPAGRCSRCSNPCCRDFSLQLRPRLINTNNFCIDAIRASLSWKLLFSDSNTWSSLLLVGVKFSVPLVRCILHVNRNWNFVSMDCEIIQDTDPVTTRDNYQIFFQVAYYLRRENQLPKREKVHVTFERNYFQANSSNRLPVAFT